MTVTCRLATDDCHVPGYDSAFASVWVLVEEGSADGVLDALGRGRFYSSTGPRILDVAVGEYAVTVRSTPAASVQLVTTRMLGAPVNAGRMGYRSNGAITESTPEEQIVEARLDRWPSWPYGRVEVIDGEGRRAWTNPLWFGI
jgi:hypothetical protein